MSNFNLYLMTALVFLAVVALFVINFSSYASFGGSSLSLSKNDIGGVAVEHKGQLYVLNYDQQNQLIDWLNQSVAADEQKTSQREPTLNVDKIIVYPLDGKTDIEISPLKYDAQGNLIFVYGERVRRDTTGGELKKLLSQTYDN